MKRHLVFVGQKGRSPCQKGRQTYPYFVCAPSLTVISGSDPVTYIQPAIQPREYIDFYFVLDFRSHLPIHNNDNKNTVATVRDSP